MAGTRGPIGKATGQHLGHRTRAQEEAITHLKRSQRVSWPAAAPDWPQEVRQIYLGLKNSATAKFFEPSDVAIAYANACQHAAFIAGGGRGGPRSNGQMYSVIMDIWKGLLGTEEARRRLRIELVDEMPDGQKVDPLREVMDHYKKSMKKRPDTPAIAAEEAA